MKILLFFFSGSGNTLHVAEEYRKDFLPDEVTLFPIRKPEKLIPDLSSFDLLGFAYPIHAFNTPKPVIEFLKRLPSSPGKKYFLFKTSGECLRFNQCSSRRLIHLLKKKGYECVQEWHYPMPYNIIFRHSDAMAKTLWVYAKAMVQYNVTQLKEKKSLPPHFRPLQGLYVPFFRIEQWYATKKGHQFWVNPNKCIHCNSCVYRCPMGNITRMGDRYVFGKNCCLCLACSFHCPKDAINLGIFENWKVNGDYEYEKISMTPAIHFPCSDGTEKKIHKTYLKYFRRCDALLKKEGIDLTSYYR
jgi:NAD-dependent dihydropyrimidine dehydrogenase PreA subunit/flavodoxin